MQDPNCIFCKIIKKEIPAYQIYEDENSFAFLDIHPINPGHIIVIPKVHEPDFYKLGEKNYQALMSVVKKLSENVQNQMQPKKVGLLVAGFDVPHTHVHIIPMHNNDDITSKSKLEGKISNPTEKEFLEVQNKFIKLISS